MKTETYIQNNETQEIDLNGNESIPTTKKGNQMVLRSHRFYINGEMVGRLFSQPQVKKFKESGEYISDNDPHWFHRELSGQTRKLFQSNELNLI